MKHPLRLHNKLELMPSDTIAIIGAGGKTTALWRLAQERREAGYAALVTTSTKILLPSADQFDYLCAPENADALRAMCANGKICCALYPQKEGKHKGLPSSLFTEALAAGLHPLYEADGAACMPAKLHAAHEPVLHAGTDRVLLIAGLRALGQPVSTVCHRYQLSPHMAAQPSRRFDLDDLLETLYDGATSCGLPKNRIHILLNQADTPALAAQVQPVLDTLNREGFFAVSGSLQNSTWP